MSAHHFKFDAFISHAVEDKLAVANELCNRLEEAGLKLWYSGKELKVGDQLERSIENGLQQSRYGIVILSKTYLQKNWPRKEYYMLKSKEHAWGKVILPVLYDITIDELQSLDIHIADRWAVSVNAGMDVVVEKLLEEIRSPGRAISNSSKASWKKPLIIGSAVLIALALTLALWRIMHQPALGDEELRTLIEAHIQEVSAGFQARQDNMIPQTRVTAATASDVAMILASYQNMKSKYRNEFILHTDARTVRSKKRVQDSLDIDADRLIPQNNFTFKSPAVYLRIDSAQNKITKVSYIVENKEPVSWQVIARTRVENDACLVKVQYENGIRHLVVMLLFPSEENPLKKYQMNIMAFLPVEQIRLEYKSGKWRITSPEANR